MTAFTSISQPELIYREALEALDTYGIRGVAAADARAAIDQIAPDSQWVFIWAAEDAGVRGLWGLVRLASVWLANAAVNLTDDLADGDGDYLEPRVAPGVAFLLLAAAGAVAAEGRVATGALHDYQRLLALAAAGQSREVRTQAWTAQSYQEVATLIAGQQYAAYLRLLWDGTTLEPHAEAIGRDLGCLGLIATDVASGDPRYCTLSAEGQTQIHAWCSTLTENLKLVHLRCADEVVELAERHLGARLR